MGIIDKWKTFHWPQKKSCDPSNDPVAVTLEDISPLFNLLAGAMFVITGVLFLEIISVKYKTLRRAYNIWCRPIQDTQEVNNFDANNVIVDQIENMFNFLPMDAQSK